MTLTSEHLPFPDLTSQQRQTLIRWLYSAADREARRQQRAMRTQDRLRHAIRANAFRDAIAELSKEQLSAQRRVEAESLSADLV